MYFDAAIEVKNLKKKFKHFELSVPALSIPKGFATAFIGENGAGKTTFLNIISGIRLDYQGEVLYFDEKEKNVDLVREDLGYTGTGLYYFPQWRMKQIAEIYQLLFDHFHEEKFFELCSEMKIFSKTDGNMAKKVNDLSDGNKMKLMIAGALSRDTRCLIMDEPASPLDPLMRDKLCDLIRQYLDEGNGEKSVIFSTHNISDMENVTDYAVIVENGKVVEYGFVEELKEKYILVKGNSEDAARAKEILYSINTNKYGFEGLCLAGDLDRLAGLDVSTEVPTLHQISVAVMGKHSA